ncbi:MAG: hypothetical protein IAE77_04795 [Prosthecobacter sp.]|jgi:hypothetical protein|uniref:hypothetical protein n=1 Tax=Prosthecobacter sp. TaxID=1965333 RepID=UPI0019E98C46|nr:hypothetical protein [Prosthecobacter sp.]MBE2282762.1 hypothetical protein [Prosthecobacter sp.]
MKSTSSLFLAATMLASPILAQTPADTPPTAPAKSQVLLTPAQTAHILKELEKAETLIGQGRNGLFSTALTKFREGMASEAAAVGLYLDCYKLENFDRKDLKQTDFMEWRDRNEERLKDDDFKKGLMLQLEYLVMTIQAQDVKETKKMGPLVVALQAFVAKAVAAVQESTKHTASGAVEAKDSKGPPGGGRRGGGGGGGPGGTLNGLLRQPVQGCDFAKAYLLQDYLDKKDWEYSPLDIDGIYTKAILPYYLQERPTEVAAQWDARINASMSIRKAVMSDTEFGIYYKEEGPRLQWEKNSYLVTNGLNAVNALAEMLKVIQANPNHPDAAGWLEDFRETVESVSEPGTAPVVEKPIGSQ